MLINAQHLRTTTARQLQDRLLHKRLIPALNRGAANLVCHGQFALADPAFMESFFGILKSEFFYLSKFDSIELLEAGLRKYIHYYNHERIKTKLKGLSPVQYRTR